MTTQLQGSSESIAIILGTKSKGEKINPKATAQLMRVASATRFQVIPI
ncbi:MAG: hypothetical protein ACE369_06745 [Roseovarius sp.]